ncbi:hypothetical protein ACFPIK_13135 [Algoriphagus aquatilis]|uniref:Lipoprotein n=1 Tax=Algoriphagus aquatilis TaxID=490186 RepID=A0ABW0C054_9BACT
MKYLIYVLNFLILTSCDQSNSNKESQQEISSEKDRVDIKDKEEPEQNLNETTEYANQGLSSEFKKVTTFNLTDTLIADLNGDGKLDQAVFNRKNETSGIVITHGETSEKIKIGFGELFAHLTDFNWVDYWGLVYDSETYEIVIEDDEIIGGREVKLDNPAIVVRKEEVGGGLITFKEGRYIWIHQAH